MFYYHSRDKKMKKKLLGLLLGGFIGWWVGMNIGMEQPIFNNPLVKGQSLALPEWNVKNLKEDMSTKSQAIYKDTESINHY